jgi:hypothetical protein
MATSAVPYLIDRLPGTTPVQRDVVGALHATARGVSRPETGGVDTNSLARAHRVWSRIRTDGDDPTITALAEYAMQLGVVLRDPGSLMTVPQRLRVAALAVFTDSTYRSIARGLATDAAYAVLLEELSTHDASQRADVANQSRAFRHAMDVTCGSAPWSTDIGGGSRHARN